VDDEPDITSSFKEDLRDNGFEQVDISNDPQLALKNSKAGVYDLLIIDIVMPEMDGFSLYEKIRKIDNKVKVCFITAFAFKNEKKSICCHESSKMALGCPFHIRDYLRRLFLKLLALLVSYVKENKTWEGSGEGLYSFGNIFLS